MLPDELLLEVRYGTKALALCSPQQAALGHCWLFWSLIVMKLTDSQGLRCQIEAWEGELLQGSRDMDGTGLLH